MPKAKRQAIDNHVVSGHETGKIGVQKPTVPRIEEKGAGGSGGGGGSGVKLTARAAVRRETASRRRKPASAGT
eukprot:365867-Chlamydomonas_euryale.AAC.1